MRTRIRELRAVLPPVYWTVWLGTLVNRAGSFVVPVLTFYLTDALGLSLAAAGAVVSMFGAGSVCAALVGGMLADRLGRKVTMVGSLFGGAITMVVLSSVSSPFAIGAATFAAGFVGDLYRPAVSAFVSDVVPAEHRQTAYGLLYWAINIGFSIAPIAAGAVATFSYRALFLGDAVTSAIFAVIIFVRVPESHPDPTRMHLAKGGIVPVLRDRSFMWFWGCALLQGLVTFQLTTTLSGWMETQGFGPGAYGAVLSVNGIVIVLLQPFITEWTKRFDRRNVMAASALLTGIGFALHGTTALLWMHATAVAVWTVGEMFSASVSPAFVAERAPPLLRGRYQGVYSMSWGLAAMLAPIIGPRVLAHSHVALWGGCAVVGLISALGYRAMQR
ncbi:MAG: MFS transporter [Kofleriaceae bacterium]